MSITIVYKLIYLLLNILGGGSFSNSVSFESLESKTIKNKPVFNEVSLTMTKNKDIWKMKQSHHGLHAQQWDHIEIHVYKDTTPYQVTYHQIKDNKEVEYKADCLRCHVNGPRLIRPKYDSKNKNINFKEKFTINKWNILIKSYGAVILRSNTVIHREFKLVKDNKIINVNACTRCHYKGGPRNALTMKNKGTILFMIENDLMPPWPHKITKKEKNELKRSLYGL